MLVIWKKVWRIIKAMPLGHYPEPIGGDPRKGSHPMAKITHI